MAACRVRRPMLLGGYRPGRWPILARASGEEDPNLKATTPKSPVRLTGGRTRLLPADGPSGVISAPRNVPWPSRASLAGVSSCDPKAA
jgi:hypothetical protein